MRSESWAVPFRRTIALLLFAMAGPAHPAEDPRGTPPANAVGFDLRLDALPSPHPRPVTLMPSEGTEVEAYGPIWLRFAVPWALVEKQPGQYSWAAVDEIVNGFHAAGYGIVLAPEGGHPIYDSSVAPPLPPEEAWAAFLRAMASRYAAQVDDYLIGASGAAASPAPDARLRAFAVKSSSVALRAADPGARIALAGPGLDEPDPSTWVTALCAEGIGPYLDVVAVRAGDAGAADARKEAIAALRAALLPCDPGARLWLTGIPLDGRPASAGLLVRGYLSGLRQEAALTTFSIPPGEDGMPGLLPVLDRIRRLFLPSDTPLVESSRGISAITAMGEPLPLETVRLYGERQQRALLAYDPGPRTARGSQAVLLVDSLEIAEPFLHDVAAGERGSPSALQRDEAAGITRLPIPLAEYPLVLEYRRRATEQATEDERLQVTAERIPSVEEILAKHQAVQASREALLQTLTADARIDYHFRISAGTTIDMSINAGFFFDRETGGEFEQREFFVNGVKWRGNKIPEFPLPQPEKVLTLPLDLNLDRRYAYRLDGSDAIDGRSCWVVAFEPADATGTLYSGRVWIDKESWERVRVSSVQTGLEPPILSNEESDRFTPVAGPGGVGYWVLGRIEGQQIFSAVGRNLVLLREITFTNHRINAADFRELRERAYASENPIVRETPIGQRYLEKTEEGRQVKEAIDHDNLFLLGGVFHNRSLDFPIPLAGVNYFNRDLGGRGIQTNVFFGGVLLRASASHPDLFGAGLDATADLALQGFSGTDRPVRDGRELEEEAVDVTGQSLTLGLGWPFADYWKIKAVVEGSFEGYAKDEETRKGYVIPRDTWAGSAGLEGEFNRAGWTVSASMRATRRQDWECWGDCPPSGASGEFEESASDSVATQAEIAKDVFLPNSQKLRGSVTVFSGHDLDRFSRHRFEFFGNRVRGLSGTGVRFTRGTQGRLGYSFNLGTLVRFDATLDHAVVTDPDRTASGPPGDRLGFTGFGLSGQTIVGPNLIVGFDWGVAIRSDVDDFDGEQEFLVSILKLIP